MLALGAKPACLSHICKQLCGLQARKRAAFLKEHLGRDLQLDEYEQVGVSAPVASGLLCH